ncbi:hypothetical protein MHLNE_13500 [Moorella humiferrea]|jgi:hypothetical protein|uniref:Uncharacterized protein n=1 Tax=Neomoorella humiferrea TaxID=676965 RepID=A0A2T0AQ24_9FIRM|nr:hypothetical protein MOHU_16930 [Moorella humiferrea]
MVLLKAAPCAREVPFSRPGETPGAEVSLSRSLLPGAGKSNPKGAKSLVMGRPPNKD